MTHALNHPPKNIWYSTYNSVGHIRPPRCCDVFLVNFPSKPSKTPWFCRDVLLGKTLWTSARLVCVWRARNAKRSRCRFIKWCGANDHMWNLSYMNHLLGNSYVTRMVIRHDLPWWFPMVMIMIYNDHSGEWFIAMDGLIRCDNGDLRCLGSSWRPHEEAICRWVWLHLSRRMSCISIDLSWFLWDSYIKL